MFRDLAQFKGEPADLSSIVPSRGVPDLGKQLELLDDARLGIRRRPRADRAEHHPGIKRLGEQRVSALASDGFRINTRLGGEHEGWALEAGTTSKLKQRPAVQPVPEMQIQDKDREIPALTPRQPVNQPDCVCC